MTTRLANRLFVTLAFALFALTSACGRTDLVGYDIGDGGGLPDVTRPPLDGQTDAPQTACTSNEGCASTPATPFCELPPGVCVACLTDPDTCPMGEVCNPATHTCIPGPTGCTNNSECPASKPICDTSDGVCVICLTAANCPAGDVCQNFQCFPSCGGGALCTGGLSCCNGACVDEVTNVDDCGGCNVACAPSQTCAGGSCQTPPSCRTTGCPNSEVCCHDVCTNIETIQNCGACDSPCPPGSNECLSGACCTVMPMGMACGIMGCAPPTQLCGQNCVDEQTDPNNCGGCDIECLPGEACVGGHCHGSNNCGAMTCTQLETCCSQEDLQACVNTQTDPNNCGQCFNACPPGAQCQEGQCLLSTCMGGPTCPPPTTCCPGGCVDTQNDPNNCSECGFQCPSGDTCQAGDCVAPTSCNGGPVCTGNNQCCPSGCSNVLTDPNNCGQCDLICPVGDTCQMGNCKAPASCNGGPVCMGTDQCCATGCSDVETDPKNCGSCGHPCAPSDTCVGGTCTVPTTCNGGPACTGGQSCCPTGCVAENSDPSNCGGCGIICSPGSTCTDGSCVSNEGAFNPTVNPTYLSPGVHSFTTINIPAGVTVYVAGPGAQSGTLDLSATGAIVIDGTINVSGGPGTQNTITSMSTDAGEAGAGGYTGEPYQSAGGSAACAFIGGNPGSLGDGVEGSAGSCTIASTTVCINQGDQEALLFTSPLATYGGGAGVFTGYRAYGSGGGGPGGGAPGALGAAYPGEGDCSGVSGGGGAVNGAGGAGGGAYSGKAGSQGQTQCPGINPGVPPAYVGGGGGGSIGTSAVADLAVGSTFQTGAGGGGGSADYLNRPVFGGTSGGGGGGGALKLASPVSITIAGQVLANGGPGGDAFIGIGSDANCDPQPGAAGGGGSGGVIYISSPVVSVTGTVSAVGGTGGAGSEFATGGGGGAGGLGRIRLSATQSSCTLSGSFSPALRSGCAAASSSGFAYVGTYPN
jgi:hypothetical protein